MSNEKRFVVKHGLQSQNMEFVSPDKSKRISVSMLDAGTISFSGDSGELFSVTDTMSGTIFAVNDISGMPSIEVDDDGIVRIAESVGNVLIGTTVDNGNKLQVSGSASVSGNLSVNGGISATSGDLNLDTLDLNAITTSKAVTAVDVFVYDTSKDSDRGAWRKRTQHTSWYNETLNTATRGSRREFPAVAVIVAEAAKVTIYDGDDPTLPMWIVFDGISSPPAYPVTCIYMLNGDLGIGRTGGVNQNGLLALNFVEDRARHYGHALQFNSGYATTDGIRGDGTLFGGPWDGSLPGIVNYSVNDVAMTVLPNAPIDAATGLPVPTIAVATAGGVSVIKDDGTVQNSDLALPVVNIMFDPDNLHVWAIHTSTPYAFFRYSLETLLYSDASAKVYYNTYPFIDIPSTTRKLVFTNTDKFAVSSPTKGFFNVLEGERVNLTTHKDLLLQTTSTYNTGWMNGNIKGAFLSDTSATALVGSGELVTNGTFDTDTDWVKGTGWTISGGTAVATSVNFPAYLVQTNVGLINNATYIITLTISNYVNGSCNIQLGAAGVAGPAITGNGTYSVTRVANISGYDELRIQAFSNFTANIDNISVKLADADRSVNNTGIVVNGTIIRTPVATGSELVGYSGFSATNYLEQPYNSDLDFGTGDFCVMGWVKTTFTSNQQNIFFRADGAGSGSYFGLQTLSGYPRLFTVAPETTSTGAVPTINDGNWYFVCGLRRSGVLEMFVNGSLASSVSEGSRNLTNALALANVGRAGTGNVNQWGGSLALLRISATAPTADQILKIYNDEKFLFQDNAACTLYGSSDAVTALAHDPDTDLLHVGTSAGRSVFQGLRRVSNTTNPVGTAISACNGLVVEE